MNTLMHYYSPFIAAYQPKEHENSCTFCDPARLEQQLLRDGSGRPIENEYFRWVANWFPKFEGATMVVPKRHITRLGDFSPEESAARDALIARAAEILGTVYPSAGTEVYLQTGMGSVSTIKHLHWHVFPAQESDPLRAYEKTGRFFTTVPNEQKIILFPIAIRLAKETLVEAVKKAV